MSHMYLKFLRVPIAVATRLGNFNAGKRIVRFCEACNGCCFYFISSLIKSVVWKRASLSLVETQPACAS